MEPVEGFLGEWAHLVDTDGNERFQYADFNVLKTMGVAA